MTDFVSVTFSIWSKKFSSSEITAMFAIVPDRVALMGSERTPPRALPVSHGWHLVAECGGNERAERCLSQLLVRASPIKAQINELLLRDPESRCAVVVYLSKTRSDLSLDISRDILTLMASLGASLFVDTVDMSEEACDDGINL